VPTSIHTSQPPYLQSVSGLFSYLGVPVLVLGLRIWSKLRSLVLPDSFERP
jgi:hypothetical protein